MLRFVLPALICATPVVAQDVDPVPALVTAIEQAGCIVTVDNSDAVLAASGLDNDQTIAAIEALYLAGAVSLLEDGSMKLTNETCP